MSNSNGLGRILIVDDEAGLVTALLSTLREQGYVAMGATNPTDALAMIRRERFDVMLTDLHLPEIDGIALLRSALEIDPNLIGIMMTGHGTIDTAVDAMKAGAVDYVLKPFKLRTVLTVLGRALELRRLRQENEDLTRRLTARTQELEVANKELEAFSYSVSHDLRAPLRAIEGFTEALVEEVATGSTENVHRYQDRIQNGVNRMSSMIDDLLRMAKAVRAELKIARVDVGEMIREYVSKLRAQSPGRNVELIVEGNFEAWADPGLLAIALENLIGNAWKYTGKKECARIEVRAERSGDEKIFRIADNGVGFEMEEAANLFAPFQRLGSAASFEGTGVGLTTVQRIVQRHGGRVWAEAELGQGATFYFSLPTSPDAPPAVAAGQEDSQAAKA